MSDEGERCDQTIDIEEFIEMEKRKEQAIATITYNSGRTETITGKLKADESFYKTFTDKINAFKSFPTVVSVDVVKH
jgi:hypothetical protein